MSAGKKQEDKDIKIIEEPIQTVDGVVRIKRYVQLRVVGSGSYSKCYLVKNMDSDSTYVAKVIPKKKLEILQKQKLIYEIKIHQSLSHPHIVHLDHWFEDDNNQYIFMEFCPNGNLESKLQAADGSLSEQDIKRYGAQIVRAIGYIHSQNILHRDLKLCNFYLDEKDNVKLGDFGFACQLASQYDKKRETCGTPNYIAPEAISGFGYSYSSDVWAIGVILYRLKYGSCPFEGDTVKKTLENVKLRNFKFPSKPKISSQLKDLIEKIFDLNYDDRLTTEQILQHKFFMQAPAVDSVNESQVKQKRGFSLSRLFSSDKNRTNQKSKKELEPSKQSQSNRGRQGIMQRESRNTSNKKQEPKRSNSCQTFKEIKQIFKNKSKQNLASNNTAQTKKDSAPSPYYTLNTIACTSRDKDGGASKTNRASILEYSYSTSLNQTLDTSKKQQSSRSNRLNEFIKSHVNSASLKEQLKIAKLNNSKNSISNTITTSGQAEVSKLPIEVEPQVNTNSICLTKPNLKISSNPLGSNFVGSQKIVKPVSQAQQQLYAYSRKYYLPLSIQQEKDVLIVHYRSTIKQVIYCNAAYVMYRSAQNIYKMSGELAAQADLPKMFRYILENKVDIKEYEPSEEYEYAQNDIHKVLQYLPHSWAIVKDGLMLKYGSLMVAKLFAQDGFYLCDEIASSQSLMYSVGADQTPKLLQGIVIMRIYAGWVKTFWKK